jgi:hypothetical protein
MKNFEDELVRLYAETLRGDFSCLPELFHAEYRSSTEEGEDSAQAYIEGTNRILDAYEILDSEVIFTVGNEQYVGIVHRFEVRPRGTDDPATQMSRADFYRIEDDQFIEHWGFPHG